MTDALKLRLVRNREKSKKYRLKHPESVKASRRKYRAKVKDRDMGKRKAYQAARRQLNREAYRAKDRAYYLKTREIQIAKSTSRYAQDKAAISDSYAKRMLTDGNSLSAYDFPPAIVELQRLNLIAKRKLKQLKVKTI